MKTGTNPLAKEQIEAYMDVAHTNGFDAVITISNEIPPVLGVHPVKLDARKLKRTPVYHFSWVRLLSIAIMEREVHGIDDPEQSWILGELIRYLEHEKSGALEFTDMGPSWIPLLDAVRSGLVKKDDPNVVDIAGKFDGLVRYTCLKLGQRLGVDVTPKLSRAEFTNPEERTKNLCQELEQTQSLSARIQIPGAVSDLQVKCDLRGKLISTFATVPASGQSRNQTRANWLLRTLDEGLNDVVIEAHGSRKSHAASLTEFRGDLREVLPADFPDITKFTVTQVHPMGTQKTTSGRASFIGSLMESVDGYYVDILQKQRAWSPPAPKYKTQAPETVDEESFTSEEIVKGLETPSSDTN